MCDCGREVSRPWHRYILGHNAARKLTGQGVEVAKASRISQRATAKLLGVSQTTINNARFGVLDKRIRENGRFVPGTVTKDTLRADDILRRWKIITENSYFRAARKELKKVRKYLRETYTNGTV